MLRFPALALLLTILTACSCQGRLHPVDGRLSLQRVPQDPLRYRNWKEQQTQQHIRQLLQGSPSPSTPPSPTPNPPSPGAPSSSPAVPGPSPSPSQPESNQSRSSTAASSPPSSTPPSPSTSPNDTTSGSSSSGPGTIDLCPAWAADVSKVGGSVPASPSGPDVDFSADLNAAPNAGISAADRQAGVNKAAAAALKNATSKAGGSDNSSADSRPEVLPDPDIFEPLREEEIMSVYEFLFNQSGLNLTAIEVANHSDNYIAWMELAPPPKAQALAHLDQKAPPPDRNALVVIIQGRARPPRVVQLLVGPLRAPSSWRYAPLGPDGTMEAGWLQRPYSGPEATRVGVLIKDSLGPLIPLMKAAYDGWFYDPDKNGTCNPKCLTFSLGAPFGSGPAQPSGTRVDPPPPRKGASSSSNSTRLQQRTLWAFFYRNMEGHHLHTVGLEVQFDVAALDPSEWRAGSVWFADRLWPSIGDLVAAWNTSRGQGGGNSSSSNVPADVAELLRSFKAITPNASEAIFSTFIPREARDAQGSGAPRGPTGSASTQPPGPPVVYEPTGRRFALSPFGLSSWMGWSLAMGHKPTSGINFWDVRFKGERVAYELSLQEAYAGYGGPTPMQSHVQYLDSHWGMGTAYRELVAGVDCPINAAFMDINFSFNGGPTRMRNAVCVFELPLGMPLLRHWADAGGVPLYIGAVGANSLVIRGISAVYNYDYIEDLLLHLDGSLEVSVHTTGYPQPSRYNEAREGNIYGYPLWYDVSGTIHDHLLNWKVDLDIAGTSNSMRLDQILVETQPKDKSFPGSNVPWYAKRVKQVFPEIEAQGALFWNGSSKAEPDKKAPTQLIYIVNEDKKNRWGSARGYRVQHTLSTSQVLPDADTFGNAKGISWSKYQVAVTARREWEPSGASPLNQPLPFAPLVDFDDLLTASPSAAPALKNGTPLGGSSSSTGTSSSSSSNSSGDSIRRQDLVLWVSSGLQHLPGSEDAPVTPSSGPAIGFWLRPFNYFDESAAISQPGSVVYMPAFSLEAAMAASDASERGNESFSLASTSGLAAPGNTSAPRGLGIDDARLVLIADPPTLLYARRGIQPYVGVPVMQTCLPNWLSVPAFNGSYGSLATKPGLENVTGGPVDRQGGAGAGAQGPTGGQDSGACYWAVMD